MTCKEFVTLYQNETPYEVPSLCPRTMSFTLEGFLHPRCVENLRFQMRSQTTLLKVQENQNKPFSKNPESLDRYFCFIDDHFQEKPGPECSDARQLYCLLCAQQFGYTFGLECHLLSVHRDDLKELATQQDLVIEKCPKCSAQVSWISLQVFSCKGLFS